MNTQLPAIGSTVTCAETGKPFTVAIEGYSTNYGVSRKGEILSTEGCAIREARDMLDRSRPFVCYLDSLERHVTGWKGNVLGNVVQRSHSRTGFHGSAITHVRVRDVHGNMWHGKGAGAGMCITLRPMKG